jgi:hypothetical protein
MHRKFERNTQTEYQKLVKRLQNSEMESKKPKLGILTILLEYFFKKSTSPESSLKLLKARKIGRLCRPMWHGDGACGIHL